MTIFTDSRVSNGFTMIEVAIVVAIIAVLAAFGLLTFGGASEQRDASLVLSTQSVLQNIITQGATRMDVSPKELKDAAVVTAMKAMLSQGSGSTASVTFEASGTNTFTLTIAKTDRQAEYFTGDPECVKLTGLTNFTKYKKDTRSACPTIIQN